MPHVTSCRVCDSSRLEPAVDLGVQPWGNNFLKAGEVGREPTYPLNVVFCVDCATVQLDYTVPKEVMFADHTYLSGMTRSLSEHFRAVAQEVDDGCFNNVSTKSVLDIGSNDGTQLQHFKALGYDVLGVDSSKTAAGIANEAGIPTLNRYFNLELAREINRKFDVINAAGIFFHLEELHSAAEGIRLLLDDQGIFLVQFLYMKLIVDNCAFDQIYHEHLLYYTLETLQGLLRRHGLALFDAYLSPIHGGSIIGFVAHAGRRARSDRLNALLDAERKQGVNELSTYRRFAERIRVMKADNLKFLTQCQDAGKSVFGLGAPVKGNTLLNYFGIDSSLISCLVELNELRRGLFSPGMHIPVVIERELAAPPDVYYVLSWNFKSEILAKNQHLIERGVQFFFPVDPEVAAR